VCATGAQENLRGNLRALRAFMICVACTCMRDDITCMYLYSACILPMKPQLGKSSWFMRCGFDSSEGSLDYKLSVWVHPVHPVINPAVSLLRDHITLKTVNFKVIEVNWLLCGHPQPLKRRGEQYTVAFRPIWTGVWHVTAVSEFVISDTC